MTTIAFLGPKGTFAHAALRALPAAAGATLLPTANVTLGLPLNGATVVGCTAVYVVGAPELAARLPRVPVT